MTFLKFYVVHSCILDMDEKQNGRRFPSRIIDLYLSVCGMLDNTSPIQGSSTQLIYIYIYIYSYSFILFTQGCLNQLTAVLTQGPVFTTYFKHMK